MSDQEFDNYLVLLTRLLRLGGKQQREIAGELRTHLEDRLDDLLARGVPRDEATRQALAEFGDAAGLAAEFVSLSRNRRRRWMMRLTTASVAATLLIAAGIVTFWPGSNAGPGVAEVTAQDPFGGPPAGAPGGPGGRRQKPAATLREKLEQRIDAEFVEQPLNDVLAHLSDETGIQFLVKHKSLEEIGLDSISPVTMSLKQVRLSTLLELMLEPLDLVYVEKDDLLLVTTKEDAETTMEVRVYDCRDLVAMPTVAQAQAAQAGRMGMDGMPGMGSYGPGMMSGERMPVGPAGRTNSPGYGTGSEGYGGSGGYGEESDSYGADGGYPGAGGSATPPPATRRRRSNDDASTPSDAAAGGGDPFPPAATPTETPVPAGPPAISPGANFTPPAVNRDILPQIGGGSGGMPGASGMASGGGMRMGGDMYGPGMADMGSGMPGMGSGMRNPNRNRQPASEHDQRAEQLIEIVTTAVDPQSWVNMGGPGTIGQYNGLLVISQSARTHTKIEKVLDMLREASGVPQSRGARVVR
ncbi:MAG: permease prefix domain 1-containing protein [Pirellulaceae bacterium]